MLRILGAGPSGSGASGALASSHGDSDAGSETDNAELANRKREGGADPHQNRAKATAIGNITGACGASRGLGGRRATAARRARIERAAETETGGTYAERDRYGTSGASATRNTTSGQDPGASGASNGSGACGALGMQRTQNRGAVGTLGADGASADRDRYGAFGAFRVYSSRESLASRVGSGLKRKATESDDEEDMHREALMREIDEQAAPPQEQPDSDDESANHYSQPKRPNQSQKAGALTGAKAGSRRGDPHDRGPERP